MLTYFYANNDGSNFIRHLKDCNSEYSLFFKFYPIPDSGCIGLLDVIKSFRNTFANSVNCSVDELSVDEEGVITFAYHSFLYENLPDLDYIDRYLYYLQNSNQANTCLFCKIYDLRCSEFNANLLLENNDEEFIVAQSQNRIALSSDTRKFSFKTSIYGQVFIQQDVLMLTNHYFEMILDTGAFMTTLDCREYQCLLPPTEGKCFSSMDSFFEHLNRLFLNSKYNTGDSNLSTLNDLIVKARKYCRNGDIQNLNIMVTRITGNELYRRIISDLLNVVTIGAVSGVTGKAICCIVNIPYLVLNNSIVFKDAQVCVIPGGTKSLLGENILYQMEETLYKGLQKISISSEFNYIYCCSETETNLVLPLKSFSNSEANITSEIGCFGFEVPDSVSWILCEDSEVANESNTPKSSICSFNESDLY